MEEKIVAELSEKSYPIDRGKMKTYTLSVVVEPDGDKWVAYSKELKDKGGATWGNTRKEVLENLRDVIRLVLEDMADCGELSSFP